MSEPPPRAPQPPLGRRARLRAALRRWLAARLMESLAPYAEAGAAFRGSLEPLAEARAALARDRAQREAWLRWRVGPFVEEMSVHRAWARHPGVQAIFARRHLPACLSCAVGQDETLSEVAFGYGFDLDALLGELNALLPG